MCSLPAGDRKTLADVVALNIGQLGENIVLGGATLLQVRPGARLAGLTHPSASIHQNSEKLQYSRYGAIMAYTGQETEQAATLARQVRITIGLTYLEGDRFSMAGLSAHHRNGPHPY